MARAGIDRLHHRGIHHQAGLVARPPRDLAQEFRNVGHFRCDSRDDYQPISIFLADL